MTERSQPAQGSSKERLRDARSHPSECECSACKELLRRVRVEMVEEPVHQDSLSIAHIFDGEEVVTGGADGQVWVATFASASNARDFVGFSKDMGLPVKGLRRVFHDPRDTPTAYEREVIESGQTFVDGNSPSDETGVVYRKWPGEPPHCMSCDCGMTDEQKRTVPFEDYQTFHTALMAIVYESKSFTEAVKLASDALSHKPPAEKARGDVSAFEQTAPPLWDCACNLTSCPYCGPRLAQNGGEQA